MTNHYKGLYDARYEHDACGVGLLVNVGGRTVVLKVPIRSPVTVPE